MFRPALLLALLLPLAACDGGKTSFTVRAEDDNGSATVSGNGNGQMTVKTAGFEGSLKLPQLAIKAKDLDIDGLKLFPGSTVGNFNVEGKDDSGKVEIAFESPADPGVVRAWFRDAMTKKGYKVETQGDGLSGTTDEGKPFSLALDAAGSGKSSGTLRLGK